MPYIQTRDKQSVFVRDIGSSSKPHNPPIFLLHGFGMQSLHWLPFALPLANQQRFIIPDLRGFGRSHHASFNRDCVISNLADDLADIANFYGFENIKLAGISMGAFVALQYQSNYGDQHVARYLHIDQSPKCLNDETWQWGLFGPEQASRFQQALTLIEDLAPFIERNSAYSELPKHLKSQLWANLGDFFASALSKQQHKKFAKRVCQQEQIIKHLMPIHNWPTYIHCLKAYLEQGYDMLNIIEKLTSPMSLIVGLKSEMYPCGGQLRIADHHTNCEIIAFKNSGHTPLIDQPFRLLHELRRFSQAS